MKQQTHKKKNQKYFFKKKKQVAKETKKKKLLKKKKRAELVANDERLLHRAVARHFPLVVDVVDTKDVLFQPGLGTDDIRVHLKVVDLHLALGHVRKPVL